MKKTFILMLIISLTFLACSNKEESASKMLDEALTLQQVGRNDEADKLLENIIRSYPETKIASELRKNVLASKAEAERSKVAYTAEQKTPEPVILYTPPPWAGNIPEQRSYTENSVNNRQGLSSQSGTGNIQESIPDNQLSRGSNRGSSVDLERAISFSKQANEYRRAAVDQYKTDPGRADRLSRLADQYEQKAYEHQKRYDNAEISNASILSQLRGTHLHPDITQSPPVIIQPPPLDIFEPRTRTVYYNTGGGYYTNSKTGSYAIDEGGMIFDTQTGKFYSK